MGFVAAASLAAVRPSPAPAKHMLFRVRGPHGATVYLLGSVHLLTPEAGKLPPEVDSAFAHAKTVAFETSLDSLQSRAAELLALARNAPGTTLRSALTPTGAEKADSVLKGYGLSVDALAPYKPWFATLVMTQLVIQKAKFQPEFGVDAQLNARAHAANKPIDGARVSRLSAPPLRLAHARGAGGDARERAHRSIRRRRSSSRSRTRGWSATPRCSTACSTKRRQESPALFDKIVVERNKSWIPRIDAMLQGTGRRARRRRRGAPRRQAGRGGDAQGQRLLDRAALTRRSS